MCTGLVGTGGGVGRPLGFYPTNVGHSPPALPSTVGQNFSSLSTILLRRSVHKKSAKPEAFVDANAKDKPGVNIWGLQVFIPGYPDVQLSADFLLKQTGALFVTLPESLVTHPSVCQHTF